MSDPPPEAVAKVSATLKLGAHRLQLSVSVPAGPTRLDDMLPLLQILSNELVDMAEREAADRGTPVSCRRGCGACCRQLVPVSPVEARQIARLVERLPLERQQVIRARFAQARQRLEAVGMWQQLQNRATWPESAVAEVGLAYFRLGIPCPFLEDESCSIHPQRPLTCREYLVTSPAEHCADPSTGQIQWVPLPAKVWVAAARCEPRSAPGAPASSHDHPAGQGTPASAPDAPVSDRDVRRPTASSWPTRPALAPDAPVSDRNQPAESQGQAPRYVPWVPLIQALEWAEEHPPPPAEYTGPELVRQVLAALAGGGGAKNAAAPAGGSPTGEVAASVPAAAPQMGKGPAGEVAP
jgi:Fe-S-cluster containining protein